MDNVHVPQSPLRAGSPLGQRDGGEDSFGAPEQPVQNAEVGYRVVPDGEEEDARAGEAMEAGNVSGFSNPDFVAELSPPKMGSIASRRTSQVGWRSSSFVSCMRVWTPVRWCLGLFLLSLRHLPVRTRCVFSICLLRS